MGSEDVDAVQLTVDISRCDGCGACAPVCPDQITLDPWGFPHIAENRFPDDESLRRAAWAIWSCPRAALTLADMAVTAGSQ